MKQKKVLLFVAILIIFLATRLFKLTEIPGSLYWDEASIGYNAYSILMTGNDEWGQYLPLHFRAFGEYKLPVYIYSVSLIQFFLGPTETSVRLPSVIFSLLTIIVVYFLALKITQNFYIALFSSFLLVISPWLFIFSRTGFEASGGLMFYLLGILLFLNSNKKNYLFLISTISFILAMYSYNSFIFFTPLTLVILVFFIVGRINFSFTTLVISVVSIFIFSLSLIPVVINPGIYDQNSRFHTVSIISKSRLKSEALFNISKNYLKHFDPQFLFISGDKNLRHNISGFGEIYLVLVPFLLGGIYIVIKKRGYYLLPLILLLIAPLPSSISIESPHSLRAIAMAPFLVILISKGVYEFSTFFKNQLRVLSIFAGVLLLFFLYYLNSFYVTYPKIYPIHWQYGYKKIFQEDSFNFKKYDQILISNRQNQPYIFALFYLRYDPKKFRKEVKYNSSITKVTSLVDSFGKFTFANIDYYQFPKGKSLIFADPSERLTEIPFNNRILNLDGSVAFYVYEFNKD